MSEEGKAYSVASIIVTAVVGFLVTGVGGAMLQKYVSRSKPEIVVNSAGFEGGADLIEVPDELMALSVEDSWGESLARYESFSSLRQREEDAGDTEARLTKAITSMELWLKDVSSGNDPLGSAELLKHPLINDTVVGSSLNGMIRRRELQSAPVVDIATMPAVFPLFKRDNDPVLHTGRVGVRFPTGRFMDQQMFDLNRIVAESFSKGVRRNVLHFSTQFLDAERKNVLSLKKFRERLRALLLEQSRPTVTIVVHNGGDSPVAFRPYFGMNVLGGDGKTITDSYILVLDSARQSGKSELEILLKKDDDEASRREVKVDSYLPKVGGLAYTSIAPGASSTLRLVATSKMGAKGVTYRAAYESGLLNTKVLGLTADGASVWSGISVFGANINKSSEDDILQRLKR